MPLATPAASPSPMLAPQAVAPASEALVVAVAGAAPSAASVDVPPAAALDNGPSGKASISKVGADGEVRFVAELGVGCWEGVEAGRADS